MDTSLLDYMNTPALMVGADGVLEYANTAAGSFWRSTKGRLLEFNLKQLFGVESQVVRRVQRCLETESPFAIEDYRFEQGEDAEPLNLRLQMDPVVDGAGASYRVLLLFWDQTHRKVFQAEEQEKKLSEAIAMMVNRLAHELRNPLSGVKGATQLLQRHLKTQPRLAEYTGVILKELERLERLTKTLLAHGAEPPIAPQIFNLHELLDEVIWFEKNSGEAVEVIRDYDPSLPEMVADRDRLHQVFLNLLRNAIHAGPKGSAVIVRTGMEGPWIQKEVTPKPSMPYFKIEVEDQGTGVREENLQDLFTPFFTTKKSGTGLGLSISQQIARAHQGFLRYRPGRNKGSVFTVLIPLGNWGNKP